MDSLKSIFENVEKKYLYMGGGFLLLMFVAFLFGSCNRSSGEVKTDDYKKIQEMMVDATKLYFEENSRLLPREGAKKDITVPTLVNNEFLVDINTIVPEGVTCTGKVVVSNVNREYNYVPFLDCGEAFSEVALFEDILDNNEIVEEGIGLYDNNGYRYFRGEVKTNYVQIEDTIWRIMSLDDEDNIALVYESTTGNQKYNLLSYSFSWDDRYNEKTEKNTGVNNFELSRISDVLIAEQSSNEFLPKELIAKVNFRNLCVGALKPNEETKDNSIECLKTTNDKYFFSLPTVSDYTLVSLDNNCKTITDKSCANYNYLNDYTSTFWLLTATEDEKNNNDFVYNANYSGITSREARNRLTVRPVLFLDNTLIKTGGEGIKSNPYIVK